MAQPTSTTSPKSEYYDFVCVDQILFFTGMNVCYLFCLSFCFVCIEKSFFPFQSVCFIILSSSDVIFFALPSSFQPCLLTVQSSLSSLVSLTWCSTSPHVAFLALLPLFLFSFSVSSFVHEMTFLPSLFSLSCLTTMSPQTDRSTPLHDLDHRMTATPPI